MVCWLPLLVKYGTCFKKEAKAVVVINTSLRALCIVLTGIILPCIGMSEWHRTHNPTTINWWKRNHRGKICDEYLNVSQKNDTVLVLDTRRWMSSLVSKCAVNKRKNDFIIFQKANNLIIQQLLKQRNHCVIGIPTNVKCPISYSCMANITSVKQWEHEYYYTLVFKNFSLNSSEIIWLAICH